LFELAIKFKFEIIFRDERVFKIIYKGCQEKSNRFSRDDELLETLSRLKEKYTFMQLKKIKDEDYEQFSILKKQVGG